MQGFPRTARALTHRAPTDHDRMQKGVPQGGERGEDRPHPASQGTGCARRGRLTERKVGFRSLGDTWADTTTAHGRLLLTVLGGLAEFERELIRARTGEGRARAKARGKSLGRPFKLTAHQRREALARREGGELLSEIARSYNVSSSTVSRL